MLILWCICIALGSTDLELQHCDTRYGAEWSYEQCE